MEEEEVGGLTEIVVSSINNDRTLMAVVRL